MSNLRRMNKPVLGFVAVLIMLGVFLLPMRELCACLSSSEALAMNFGAGQMTDKQLMADAQLSKEVKAKMEGFDIQKTMKHGTRLIVPTVHTHGFLGLTQMVVSW